MKRILSKFTAFALAFAAIITFPLSANAAEKNQEDASLAATAFSIEKENTGESSVGNTENDNTDINYKIVEVDLNLAKDSVEVSKMIDDALFEAKNNATPKNQYKIILADGEFRIDGTLNIYSNTFLEMTGTTLIRDHSRSESMLKVGNSSEENTSYNGYGNITINGGTFDGWDNKMTPSTSNLLRMGHSRNILISNVTFTDNTNSHCIEIGACKDVTIKNCTFKDQYLFNKTNASEAIQLDALEKHSFPLYELYDGTSCRNITITECNFQNVTRAIGSHSVILDKNGYYRNINITNNSFSGIKEYAIVSLCWINSTISNNVISNCKNGILFRTMRSDFNRIYNGNFTAPITNYNSLIIGNRINANNIGIKLYGTQLSKNVEWKDSDGSSGTIPTGNYLLSNVTVKDNTLNVKGNVITGYHIGNSKITNNTVINSNSSENKVGIYLSDVSYHNNIYGNTIGCTRGNILKAGILISGSASGNNIKTNSIRGKSKNGIYVYSGANNSLIYGNEIIGSRTSGINSYGCKNITIGKNTVKPYSGDAISFKTSSTSKSVYFNEVNMTGSGSPVLVKESKVTQVKSNNLTGGGTGIYAKNASVANITNNTCTNNNYGIYSKSSKVKYIKGNSVSSPKKYGVKAANTSNINISGNKITKPGKFGIYLDSSLGYVQSNSIKNSKNYGIYFNKYSKGLINKNSFSSNKEANICIKNQSRSIKINYISSPKKIYTDNLAYNKAELIWSRVKNANYYRIYRSTDNKTYKYIDGTSAKYNSYTDKGVTSGKAYYYRVTPVVSNGQTSVLGNNSSVKKNYISPEKANVKTSVQSNTTQVIVRWNSGFEPKYYQIYRKTAGEKNYSLIKTVSGKATAYRDKSTVPGKTYYYRVRQVCYNGQNKAMPAKMSDTYAKIKTKVLPVTLKPIKITKGNKALIAINIASGNTGYEIFHSTDKNGKYKKVKTLPVSHRKFSFSTKLTHGKKDYFKVRAYYYKQGKTYYSDFSSPKTIEFNLPAVKINKIKCSSQRVYLRWTQAKGDTSGYKIMYRKNNGKWNEMVKLNKDFNSCLTDVLGKDSEYSFKIVSFKKFNGKYYYGNESKIASVKINTKN